MPLRMAYTGPGIPLFLYCGSQPGLYLMTHSNNGHIDRQAQQEDSSSARPGKADLHMHTSLGDGLASVEQIFDYVENYTDLDIIAITDHDDSRGALQALELIEKRKY